MLCVQKKLLHLCQITISEKPPCVLSEQKFSFQQEFKVLQEFDFLWVWSLSCHIAFFEKKIEQNLFFDHDLSVTYGSLSAHPCTCSASGTLKLWAVNSHVLSIPSSNAMWKIPHRRKFFGNPFPFLRTFGCRDISCM